MSLYKCNVLVRGRHSETYSLFDAVIQDLPDGRRHLRAPFAVRREYAVKPSETDTRPRPYAWRLSWGNKFRLNDLERDTNLQRLRHSDTPRPPAS